MQPQPPIDPTLPEYSGPYDAVDNGTCACHDLPVNAFGRCEPLNQPDVQPRGTSASSGIPG
jgi:hypothetical protein